MHQVGAHAHRSTRRDRVILVLDGHIGRDARQASHEAVAESVSLVRQFCLLTHTSFFFVGNLPQSLLDHCLQIRQSLQLGPSGNNLGPRSHNMSQLVRETGFDIWAGEDVVGYEAEGSPGADRSAEEDKLRFSYQPFFCFVSR